MNSSATLLRLPPPLPKSSSPHLLGRSAFSVVVVRRSAAYPQIVIAPFIGAIHLLRPLATHPLPERRVAYPVRMPTRFRLRHLLSSKRSERFRRRFEHPQEHRMTLGIIFFPAHASGSAMTTNPWDIINFQTLDPTAEHVYTSVGKALSNWEELEHYLALYFGFFCGGDTSLPAFRAYGCVASSSGRADMLRAAAEAYFHVQPEHRMQDRFQEFLKLIGKYTPRRNEIAHGIVMPMIAPPLTEPRGHYPDAIEDYFSRRGWLLVPTEYATKKNILIPGADSTGRRYAYSSVEITHYSDRFREMWNAALKLGDDWADAYPGQSPPSPL